MAELVGLDNVEEQIYQKRKSVRYDIRDLTVEIISDKYDSSLDENTVKEFEDSRKFNCIYIPEYQRDFTWDESRQSKLIESIILGLPIPFIFVAENKDSSWEIVDGSQRIRTLHNFIGGGLILKNLESLTFLNGYKFDDLESSRKGKFLNSALRLIVLAEETSEDVKKDMFERINRGSDLLKPMEKRKGIYPGLFNKFIYDYCNESDEFKRLTVVDKWLERRQEREELLLRFFYISEKKIYKTGISSGIAAKLDDYIDLKNKEIASMDIDESSKEIQRLKTKIDNVVNFVAKNFPYGFRHAQNPQTKRSVFEAISVGVNEFLESSGDLNNFDFNKKSIEENIKSKEFKRFTHFANQLHSEKMLNGRVSFIFEMLNGFKK